VEIVIVDDESLARDRLQRMLQDDDNYRVVGQAADGESAFDAVMKYDPDIILLDISMPGESGLQVAERLSELDDPPAIIFCTAYDEHALEAFAVNAIDYLVKPVRKEKLLQSLAKAVSLNKAQKTSLRDLPKKADKEQSTRSNISAKTRRGVELIDINTIYYFAADQKYVTVYHEAGETLIDDTLKELEQEFSSRFVRVHRNALLAIDRIEAMAKNSDGQFEVRLRGADTKPIVSRRHVGALKGLLTSL
jgi:two-component system response regulator AlgR